LVTGSVAVKLAGPENSADEADDLVAVGEQRAGEGGTDESGGAGDRDAHGVLLGKVQI
jgi:hypothetical protein